MDDEQRYKQYILEKELAKEIFSASPDERQKVIKDAYARLYSETTWHVGLNSTYEERQKRVKRKHVAFGWALGKNKDVLEVGCGTGEFLASLSTREKSCVGLEIAKLKGDEFPESSKNLSFEIMEGMKFPAIKDSSFDVVFTSQVLEHFHPDDVPIHLSEVYRVLRKKGVYVLDTPTSINGPHDISRGFDKVSTGMHLKEWTYSEIVPVLKRAGFNKLRVQVFPLRIIRMFPWLAKLGMWPAGWKVFAEMLVRIAPGEWLKKQLISKLVLYTLLITATKN